MFDTTQNEALENFQNDTLSDDEVEVYIGGTIEEIKRDVKNFVNSFDVLNDTDKAQPVVLYDHIVRKGNQKEDISV